MQKKSIKRVCVFSSPGNERRDQLKTPSHPTLSPSVMMIPDDDARRELS